MLKYINRKILALSLACFMLASCKVPQVLEPKITNVVPGTYHNNPDTANLAQVNWRTFFGDQDLSNLIDTALLRNQELQITLQDIDISRNDVRLRQVARLPTVAARLGAGLEKVGRYTSQGAGDATTEITPGKEMPDPLADF